MKKKKVDLAEEEYRERIERAIRSKTDRMTDCIIAASRSYIAAMGTTINTNVSANDANRQTIGSFLCPGAPATHVIHIACAMYSKEAEV